MRQIYLDYVDIFVRLISFYILIVFNNPSTKGTVQIAMKFHERFNHYKLNGLDCNDGISVWVHRGVLHPCSALVHYRNPCTIRLFEYERERESAHERENNGHVKRVMKVQEQLTWDEIFFFLVCYFSFITLVQSHSSRKTSMEQFSLLLVFGKERNLVTHSLKEYHTPH